MPHIIRKVTVVIGGPTTFVVGSERGPERELWVSSSQVILSALLPAFFNHATVSVDLVAGSRVIQRVPAYALQHGQALPSRAAYRISRIATQRTPEGLNEHLEVFLTKEEDNSEKTYNVFDPLLQTILVAAFASSSTNPGETGVPIDVEFSGDTILSVSVGNDAPAMPAPDPSAARPL